MTIEKNIRYLNKNYIFIRFLHEIRNVDICEYLTILINVTLPEPTQWTPSFSSTRRSITPGPV